MLLELPKAWKNGVRLVEVALEIFTEDHELGFARTVDAIDSAIDSALGTSVETVQESRPRLDSPNLTRFDIGISLAPPLCAELNFLLD